MPSEALPVGEQAETQLTQEQQATDKRKLGASEAVLMQQASDSQLHQDREHTGVPKEMSLTGGDGEARLETQEDGSRKMDTREHALADWPADCCAGIEETAANAEESCETILQADGSQVDAADPATTHLGEPSLVARSVSPSDALVLVAPTSGESLLSDDPSIDDELQVTTDLDDGTCSDASDEFCGEPASNSNLRRLKLEAFEDALVCERNRDTLNAARRLFDSLDRGNQQQVQKSGKERKLGHSKWAGSVVSASSADGSENGAETGSSSASERSSSPGRSASAASIGQKMDDIYDIKLVKRATSSASSGGCNTSFRRTLVCSVSPTSQLEANSSSSDLATTEAHLLYPMDGEEIRHCRTAFRENKRLIEKQQELASKQHQGQILSKSMLSQILAERQVNHC